MVNFAPYLRTPSVLLMACGLTAGLCAGLYAGLARAADTTSGDCAPPRTRVALMPLADQTDRAWAAWTGESPTRLVARLLADSIEHSRGRRVLRVADAGAGESAPARVRACDDGPALLAARNLGAEVVVTGTVSVFTCDDRRAPGRLARWGVGAPDARSHVRVSVTLRALEVADGSVLIETTAARERTARATANAARPGGDAEPSLADPLLAAVLGEVLGDLTRTLGERLDARWQARVLGERRGVYLLDAGDTRGLFTGERLDVWRLGLESYDENFMRISEDSRVGTVVVMALDGRGHARARLVSGKARAGDRVRPCAGDTPPALSLQSEPAARRQRTRSR